MLPSAAVAARLEAAVSEPIALKQGANLHFGPPPTPSAGRPLGAVFLVPTGGPVNAPLLGVDKDNQIATVQVLIRWPRDDYARGEQLAEACRVALHRHSFRDWGGLCTVREPGPTYLRQDASGSHLWSINAVLVRVA